MIKIKPADRVPARLIEDANPFFFMKATVEKFFALSSERVYVEDEQDRPLLLIGAFRPSLFSPYKELWMVGTKHLRLEHIKIGRDLVWFWVREQEVPVYARAETRSTARFLQFMGFTKIEQTGNTIQFEARL